LLCSHGDPSPLIDVIGVGGASVFSLTLDVPLLINEENKLLYIDLIFFIYTSARVVQYGEFYV